MDRENKRVRTSVFLETGLIKQAEEFAEGGNLSDVIRTALLLGLNQLEKSREMYDLKNDALEAASVGEFDRAREVIDQMAIRAGMPSTDQLREAVDKAIAENDFAYARMALDGLERHLNGRAATTPDLEELDEALEDYTFDVARKILDALRQSWEGRAENNG